MNSKRNTFIPSYLLELKRKHEEEYRVLNELSKQKETNLNEKVKERSA